MLTTGSIFLGFTNLSTWLRTKAAKLFSSSHSSAAQRSALFEATFADSGHWDYALLSVTEVFCRSVIALTWGPISETTIAERAGWLPLALSQAISSPLAASSARGFSAVTASALEGVLALSAVLALLTFGAYFL